MPDPPDAIVCSLKKRITDLEKKLKQVTMFGHVLLKRNRDLKEQNKSLKEQNDSLKETGSVKCPAKNNKSTQTQVAGAANVLKMLQLKQPYFPTDDQPDFSDEPLGDEPSNQPDRVEEPRDQQDFTHEFPDQSWTFGASSQHEEVDKGAGEREYLCLMCVFRTFRRETFVRHNMKKHNLGLNRYPCDKCDFVGTMFKHLRRHLLSCRVDSHAYTCDQCDAQFGSLPSLRLHYETMHAEKTYACERCSFTSSSWAEVSGHEKKAHTTSVFRCDLCFFKAKSAFALAKHKEKTHGKGCSVLHCTLCSFTARSKASLDRHNSRVHNIESAIEDGGDNQEYLCDQCSFTTTKLKLLTGHTDRVHNVARKCPDCDQVFKAGSKLAVHLQNKRIMPGPMHHCDECNDVFCFELGLKMHKKKEHKKPLPEKTIFCDECEMGFFSISGLTHHKSMNHNNFKCGRCSYTSSTEQLLLMHAVKHITKKKRTRKLCLICNKSLADIRNHKCNRAPASYQCDYCDQRFNMLCNKKIHMRKVALTDGTKYRCSECPKIFCLPLGVRHHRMREHYGGARAEKSFRCDECVDSFLTKSKLEAHKRREHRAQIIHLSESQIAAFKVGHAR